LTVVGYRGTLAWPPPEISYDDYRVDIPGPLEFIESVIAGLE
jgi:hypothetical protein